MQIIGANISHPVGCHLWRVVAINQLATCNRVGPKSIMATTRLRRVTALVAKSLEAGEFPVSFSPWCHCAQAVHECE